MFWENRSKFLLILILAFAFFTRVWRLHVPPTYYFDEVYHAVTAKLIANNDPRAFEWNARSPEPDTAIEWLHPPIAKYTQAFFIVIFGSNSFSWRISSALFGVGVIYLTYLLAFKLFVDEKLALLASFLASMDGLLLVESRIAMNDIHVTFFILLALVCYLRYKNETKNKKEKTKSFLLTSFIVGLATATKWSGIFLVPIIFISELMGLPSKAKKVEVKGKFFALLFLVFILLATYVASYSLMFLQGKSFSHFIELHKQIIHYQTTLKAHHAYESRPWQWMWNSRPVWMWVDYQDGKRADIYAQGNSALFFFGNIGISLSLYLLIKSLFMSKVKSHMSKELVFLLISYFFVWLPWIFSPRIMFFYHYTPAVPFLSVILAYWLTQLVKNKKEKNRNQKISLLMIIVLLIIGNFIVFFPHWTGIPISNKFVENVYFFLNSLK